MFVEMFDFVDEAKAVIDVQLQIMDIAGPAFALPEAAVVEPYGLKALLSQSVCNVSSMSEVGVQAVKHQHQSFNLFQLLRRVSVSIVLLDFRLFI